MASASTSTSASVSADADGRRALFSTEAPVPVPGSVLLTCSRCSQTSVLSLRQAARALVPSVHLPLIKRFPSLLRCPACGRPSWTRLRFRR